MQTTVCRQAYYKNIQFSRFLQPSYLHRADSFTNGVLRKSFICTAVAMGSHDSDSHIVNNSTVN